MRRSVWLLVVLALLAAGCGTSPTDDGEEEIEVAEEITSPTLIVADAPEPEDTTVETDAPTEPQPPDEDNQETQKAPTAPELVFLDEGGQYDGLLTFDSLKEDRTYDSPLTIGKLLPLYYDRDEFEPVGFNYIHHLNAVFSGLQSSPIVAAIHPGDHLLTQVQGEGAFQYSFGMGATLIDGSTRLVFLGGDETFFEFSIFTLEPGDGSPDEGSEVLLEGYNVGVAPTDDLGPIIEAAFNDFPPNGDLDVTSDNFFWADQVSGSLDAFSGELMARLEILGLESGTLPDGQMGVKVDLGPDPFADAQYSKTVAITVRDDEGAFYSGAFDMVDGAPIVSGFCFIGACPDDGTWPGFKGVLNDDGTLLFSFDPLEGALNVAADVAIDDDPDPESQVWGTFYLGGLRFPFGSAGLEF